MKAAVNTSVFFILLSLMVLNPIPVEAVDLPETELSLALVLEALSLKGIPYLWGGTNLKGMDCSGFVYTIYSDFVPDLPRRSVNQYRYGQAVPTGEEKPGDLVFFNTEGWTASHVGIYLGNRHFIHAASGENRQGIILSSLDSPYYRARYLGARRLPLDDTGGTG